ncbi:MAG TPA: hypothetical protein PKE45_15060, partial [Caldilineaceae bacterium]|nr:hypothetical protein [Caldilineaceae bacterium]
APPHVDWFTPSGGNAGVDIDIHGTNFDPYWAKVLINGAEHSAYGSATMLRFRIQPDDTSGNLVVENRYPGCAPDGFESDTALTEFHKLNTSLADIRVNQGYPGLGLVSSKPLLVQNFVTTDMPRRGEDIVQVDSVETVFTSGSDSYTFYSGNTQPLNATYGVVPAVNLADITNSVNAWLWPTLPDAPDPYGTYPTRDWHVQTTLRMHGYLVGQAERVFAFRPNRKVRVLLVPYILGGTVDQETNLPYFCNGALYRCEDLEQMRKNVEAELDNMRYRMHQFGDGEFEWWNTPKLAA